METGLLLAILVEREGTVPLRWRNFRFKLLNVKSGSLENTDSVDIRLKSVELKCLSYVYSLMADINTRLHTK